MARAQHRRPKTGIPLAVVALLSLVLAGCGGNFLEPDPEATAQRGAEELERHLDNPDARPVDIGFEVHQSRHSAASLDGPTSFIFDNGYLPTEFNYTFVVPELTTSELLQLGRADLEARGATQVGPRGGALPDNIDDFNQHGPVYYQLRSLGDTLFFTLWTFHSYDDKPVLQQTVTIKR